LTRGGSEVLGKAQLLTEIEGQRSVDNVLDPRAAAAGKRKSRPKWLRLSEGTVGTLCILEHRSDTRLLTAGKTAGGECLLGAASRLIAASILRVDDPFRQTLMHGNVVQVTKGVL